MAAHGLVVRIAARPHLVDRQAGVVLRHPPNLARKNRRGLFGRALPLRRDIRVVRPLRVVRRVAFGARGGTQLHLGRQHERGALTVADRVPFRRKDADLPEQVLDRHAFLRLGRRRAGERGRAEKPKPGRGDLRHG